MLVRVLAFLALALLPGVSSADPYLLMAEEDGCIWCEKWNAEISPVYPKTAEGRAAPLVRYDLHGEVPDVVLARSVNFTPTFILVNDGMEVGRIEGYPGEDFFWGLLATLFERAGIPLEQAG